MSFRFAPSIVPAVFGLLILGAGCTFEPPGDVTNSSNTNTNGGADGGAGTPGGADGGAPVGGDPETMSITFTTAPIGGSPYAPRNIVATWIQDAQGNHIKTIDRKAGVRVQHLIAWNQKAGANQDAVSGATRLDHQTPITATWDIALSAVPDGVYTIRIETCDDNSGTADQNNQGTFTFEKNGTASVQNLQGPGYSNVVVDYSGRPAP